MVLEGSGILDGRLMVFWKTVSRQSNSAEQTLQALSQSQAIIEFELDGTILDANENFLRAMGYSREEVIGKHHRIFVDPRDASSPEYETHWRDLRNGTAHTGEFRRIAKDGSDVWIQASYNPVLDASGKPFKDHQAGC